MRRISGFSGVPEVKLEGSVGEVCFLIQWFRRRSHAETLEEFSERGQEATMQVACTSPRPNLRDRNELPTVRDGAECIIESMEHLDFEPVLLQKLNLRYSGSV